ncbi:hypothetical protein V8G54_013492 [Vigna mungo]|uniref:Uncharacterized protein n=1 Tax=Vigna mungo TaxID=3915 RepID=A0AAQ3NT13_VIGMU
MDGLRFGFSFHLGSGEFIIYFTQEILCIKDSLFDRKKPCFNVWICELLLLCIMSESIDGVQHDVQVAKQLIIKFSSTKEVNELRRRQPVECNLKKSGKKSTTNKFCCHRKSLKMVNGSV